MDVFQREAEERFVDIRQVHQARMELNEKARLMAYFIRKAAGMVEFLHGDRTSQSRPEIRIPARLTGGEVVHYILISRPLAARLFSIL